MPLEAYRLDMQLLTPCIRRVSDTADRIRISRIKFRQNHVDRYGKRVSDRSLHACFGNEEFGLSWETLDRPCRVVARLPMGTFERALESVGQRGKKFSL